MSVGQEVHIAFCCTKFQYYYISRYFLDENIRGYIVYIIDGKAKLEYYGGKGNFQLVEVLDSRKANILLSKIRSISDVHSVKVYSPHYYHLFNQKLIKSLRKKRGLSLIGYYEGIAAYNGGCYNAPYKEKFYRILKSIIKFRTFPISNANILSYFGKFHTFIAPRPEKVRAESYRYVEFDPMSRLICSKHEKNDTVLILGSYIGQDMKASLKINENLELYAKNEYMKCSRKFLAHPAFNYKPSTCKLIKSNDISEIEILRLNPSSIVTMVSSTIFNLPSQYLRNINLTVFCLNEQQAKLLKDFDIKANVIMLNLREL
ncbi:hypothetical protein C9980_20365 [Vibrio mediterranei]|uniref:hypothetical protein n=1 Tax=Vibrio mediterranei TaxID=689 RepID=UPI000D18568A|nr:hypothetical protein [Vibrio mediterranei]PTC02973.1 hypothetical protein C9980_20365 [Vibrio mediterranei]